MGLICNRYYKRFSIFVPFSNFLSLTDQSFPSCTALQDGISQCHFSAAVSSRLGCDDRSVGCVPACSNPSGVASSSRLLIPGSDLLLQGLTVRADRLALGVHQVDSHSDCLSSSSGYTNFLLSRRLVSSSEFLGPLRFPSTDNLGGNSETMLSYHLEEVILYPVTASLLSGRSFGHSSSSRALSRPPYRCPSVARPGVGVFWISSGLSLAEVPWS